jgi:MYXO-CTERM domain-containing protein
MVKRLLSKRSLFSAATLAAALLAFPSAARAEVTAADCEVDPHWCKIAPIHFDYSDSLPIEFSFDTGWTPANSPLQVHLWAGVYATTRASLDGFLETSWPEALLLRTPGSPNGGLLAFHYGVELGAQAKISIEVAGQTYDWIGDIPYIPQIDFQVEGETTFDAWGWKPGVTLSSKTLPQRIIEVGIGDIVGGSIPGIDGGLAVDVALELEATYTTERMVITKVDGDEVEGGAITSADGETNVKYLNGAAIDLDVHPEGTVDYDGIIHLIPTFWVELLGQTWNIPIVDIPIEFPITQSNWSFEPTRVHVPLPDVVLPKIEIDFGAVEVGQKSLEDFSLWNAGEALAKVSLVSSNPDLFPAWDPSLDIDPGLTSDTAVRFMPKKNGEFTATLFIASNDPNDPVQEIVLKGIGFGGPSETGPSDDISQESSCACRTAPNAAPAPAFALAALAGATIVLRRRRRVGRS